MCMFCVYVSLACYKDIINGEISLNKIPSFDEIQYIYIYELQVMHCNCKWNLGISFDKEWRKLNYVVLAGKWHASRIGQKRKNACMTL